MKRLLTLLFLLPGTAFAHGVHAPVDPAMHGFAHAVSAVTIVALLGIVVWLWRARQ